MPNVQQRITVLFAPVCQITSQIQIHTFAASNMSVSLILIVLALLHVSMRNVSIPVSVPEMQIALSEITREFVPAFLDMKAIHMEWHVPQVRIAC
jgi:hypothetical protein